MDSVWRSGDAAQVALARGLAALSNSTGEPLEDGMKGSHRAPPAKKTRAGRGGPVDNGDIRKGGHDSDDGGAEVGDIAGRGDWQACAGVDARGGADRNRRWRRREN